MSKCRIFQEPSGNVRVLRLNERLRQASESDDAFIARIGADTVLKDPSLVGLPFVDVENAVVEALPRNARHKWRVQGSTLRVDVTIPDQPHRRQPLLDEINNATTLDALKTAIRKLV